MEGMLTYGTPSFVFDLGRRVCSGKPCLPLLHNGTYYHFHCRLVDTGAMVTMLVMLDFNVAKDADSIKVAFEVKYMSGIAW